MSPGPGRPDDRPVERFGCRYVCDCFGKRHPRPFFHRLLEASVRNFDDGGLVRLEVACAERVAGLALVRLCGPPKQPGSFNLALLTGNRR